jgi:hypothetical protein
MTGILSESIKNQISSVDNHLTAAFTSFIEFEFLRVAILRLSALFHAKASMNSPKALSEFLSANIGALIFMKE